VRLISETGEQLGVMKTEDAIARAMDVGQDCKKKQHVVKIKELRVRPRIDDHDLLTKVNRGRQFISDGCKLKITLMYRGREMSRLDLGLDVLDRIIDLFSDIAVVEKRGELEGRRQTIILTGK